MLLIDDEPAFLELTTLFLERDKEMKVIPAQSAKEGLAILQKFSLDAIVCDYDMPGMNGLDLLKTLRERNFKTPIIIFTGKGNEEVVIEALNSGADFYLQKGDNPRDKFARLSQMVHDAVIRRQTKEIIAESERKYRLIMENAPIGIISADTRGHVVDMNPMLLTLLGADTIQEMRNINILNYPPMARAGISADFQHCLTYGEGGTFEHFYVTEKGKKIYLRYRITPLFDDRKHVFGVLAAIEDFTEWKGMEEALKQANKKLSLLSSVTRHDILNQLTILIGNLEMMKSDRMDAKMKEFIKKEEVAAERIMNQIRFNKDYQDIGVHSPQWQNLCSTINKALMTINLGKIHLYIDLPDIDVYANPLFEKVFFNLVNNSVRYSGMVTTISFYTQQSEKGINLGYQDDGPGVESDEKELIFEREYGKVIGYGLFVSREILSITGMTIHERGEPGKGARFEIFIPDTVFRPGSGKKCS